MAMQYTIKTNHTTAIITDEVTHEEWKMIKTARSYVITQNGRRLPGYIELEAYCAIKDVAA